MFNIGVIDGIELPVFLAVVMCIVSFLIYWSLFSASHGRGTAVIRARFIGFFVIGVLPVIILLLFTNYRIEDLGLVPVPESMGFMIISSSLLSIIAVLVTVFNPGAPKHYKKYPQIRDSRWTRYIFLGNLISWTFYLIGYEIMFRGIIIFTLAGPLGVWPAIAVSTALYSALHLQKGMFEAAGALPLGLLFSVLTIISGSIWIAVIVHVVMALSNTLWSFKRHPDMQME